MNRSHPNSGTNRIVEPSTHRQATPWNAGRPCAWLACLAGLLWISTGTPAARAQGIPPGCSGSAIGISLFTSAPDVHIGDTLTYSVSVFNGLAGNPTSCDASNIVASLTTPDGIVHRLALRRTYLSHAQSDYYTNVVSYVVRAQDIRPDGSVRATAEDTAVIFQNDTPSMGGANQGVNTEVNLPCLQIAALCLGSAGENGAIAFTGSVTNCGNTLLVGVTVTNYANNGALPVLFPTNLAVGQAASFSGSFVPSNPCVSSTAWLVARGTDQMTASPRAVVSSNSVTCANVTTPGIRITQACPAGPIRPGQQLVFSGSVSNTGDVTLTNIVVVNAQPTPNTPVFTRPVLAPGEIAHFTGSSLVPTNCTAADTLTVTATSRCGAPVSSTAGTTCPITTTPGITVTVVCPDNPGASDGGSGFTGVVHNSGDVLLNNVTVMSTQASPGLLLSGTSLAPGASASFTARVTAPLGACTVSSTVIALGTDACTGRLVTNSASATCPLLITPRLLVTQGCPTEVGGLLTYTGSVSNAGNITLTKILVRSDRAGGNIVFGVPSLAPGAVLSFPGSYETPTDGCSVVSTLTATARERCGGSNLIETATVTCPLPTRPRIVVTQTCPPTQVVPGGTLTYSGTVSNAGNATLTNVVVTSDRTGGVIVFSLASLAPRVAAPFTGSYVVNTDCCVDTSTLTASGRDCNNTLARDTATRTCSLQTRPAIAVTTTCSAEPGRLLSPGDVLTYSSTVSNSGTITLTEVTLLNNTPANGSLASAAITLAAGESASYSASFVVPTDFCGTYTVTAHGFDACTRLPVADSAASTCPVLATPGITVTKYCPAQPTPHGGLFVFTGSVSNSGDVTLTNVFVVNTQPAPNTPVLGPITLAPGAMRTFFGSFNAPLDCCEITDTLTARGQDVCAGTRVSHSTTQICPLLSTPGLGLSLACPAAPVAVDGSFAYSGLVTNTGSEVLTNVHVFSNQPLPNTLLAGPVELAPGESEFFSGSYTVAAGAGSLTVTASGLDSCLARTVNAAANCSGAVAPPNDPRTIRVVLLGNGTVSGVADGRILNLGQSYSVTATPAAGSSFVNWSGSVTGTSPSLTFVMQSNLVLIASFAFNGTNGSNVFTPTAGTFTGLFLQSNGVQVGTSGFLTFTMTRLGTYSASLRSGGVRYSTRGRLSPDGKATNSIARPRTNALTVIWEVQSDGSDTLLGQVSDGQWVSGVTADRAVFNARTNPAPQAGRYTLIIPGTPGGGHAPEGDGYGAATLDRNGVVTFNGRLADGTLVAQSTRISRHGHWPMHVSLYAGRGSLIGWLLFTNRPNDDLAGRLSWICPAVPARNRYPAGFGLDCDSLGSRYVPPTGANRRVLEFTNGIVLLSGGDLAEASAHDVILGPNGRVTSVNPNQVTLNFTPSSGLFQGTCLEPGTTRTRAFKGAVLQKANYGSGWFPGIHEMGRVVFYAAP